MQIDDVHVLLTERAQQDLTHLATMVAPGALTLLQVEPEDSFEIVRAGIAQQSRPMILALPEHGPALSCDEHFARLAEVPAPPIVGIVVPDSRLEALAPLAHQYGMHLFPSLELVLTTDAALRSRAVLPGGASQSQSTPGVRLTGDSSPVVSDPEAGTGTSPSWQSPSFQNQKPMSGYMPAALEPEDASWFPSGETSLPKAILPPSSAPGQTQKRRLPGLVPRTNLALLALVSMITLVLFTVLCSVLVASPSATLVEPPTTTFVGTLAFGSSGQLDPLGTRGLNDVITLTLQQLPAVPAARAEYAWLLPDRSDDQTPPLLLGTLSSTRGRVARLTYRSPSHQNLLAQYSRFLVTEEDAANPPITPSLDSTTWRLLGAIPDMPTPGDEQHYSLLSHLRHLLASDPELQHIGLSGGLTLWLSRNTEKLLEWSSAARDDWASGTHTGLLRRQVIRILDYLDGTAYVGRDTPPGTPILVDPKAGRIGLLQIDPNQALPSYLAHISLHLSGLINAPGHGASQQQIATSVDRQLQASAVLMQHIRQDAVQLVSMSDAQLRQAKALSLLDEMLTNANTAYVGQQDPTTGLVQGGVTWIQGQLQRLAVVPIRAVTPPRR
jgi:hypothetical protein